jgi:hypothetical protein
MITCVNPEVRRKLKCDSQDVKSLLYYGAHLARTRLKTLLKQFAKKKDINVYVFGGIVRDSLVVDGECRRQRHPAPRELPANCFISPEDDVDVMFEARAHIQEFAAFAKHLHPEHRWEMGKAKISTYSSAVVVSSCRMYYGDLILPGVSLKIDLVCPIPGCLELPDFVCNQLQLDVETDILSLRDSAYLGTLSPCTRNGLFSGAHVHLMSAVQADMLAGKTQIMLLSRSFFMVHMKEHCSTLGKTLEEAFNWYITCIFRFRLPKIVKKGWKITNLGCDIVNGNYLFPCATSAPICSIRHRWSVSGILGLCPCGCEHVILNQEAMGDHII